MKIKTKIKNKLELLAYKYSHFFDTKLDNSTITVWIIGLFIFSVWISFWDWNMISNNANLKANVFETVKEKEEKISLSSQIIENKEWILTIWWKKYRITLSEDSDKWDRWNYCSY